MNDTEGALKAVGQLNLSHEMRDCPQHGPYMGFRYLVGDDEWSRWSYCPRCQQKLPPSKLEVEDIKEKERAVLEQHKRELDARRKGNLIAADIPDRHKASRFETFTMHNQTHMDAIQGCYDLLDGKLRNILLVGPTGVGKSHLACSAIQDAIEKGKTARWVKEKLLLGSLLEAMAEKIGGDQAEMRKYSSYDLLVIDEVGKSKLSEYEANALFNIIDDRWNANRPTIWCGNITGKDFKEHFTDPMISRIRDQGRFYAMKGEDQRAAVRA